MEEKLIRHRMGKLPKSEYSPKGKLYGRSLLGKDSPARVERLAEKKEKLYKEKEKEIRKTWEENLPRLIEKIKNEARKQKDSGNDDSGNGRGR